MTEPTPHPSDKARSLAETHDRWDDSLSTIEITKGPSKAQPVPVEAEFWDDLSGDDEDEDEG